MTKIGKFALYGVAVVMLAGPAAADAVNTIRVADNVVSSPVNSSLASSSGMIALNSLPNPPTTLATAKVEDAKGMPVGAVQKVVMDTAGKPQTVEVSLLGSGAVVAIAADKFNYDQGHNVLTAALDAQQIAQQPRAPQG